MQTITVQTWSIPSGQNPRVLSKGILFSISVDRYCWRVRFESPVQCDRTPADRGHDEHLY